MPAGTFVFNVAKGRIGELTKRVKDGDPSGSRLVAIPILASGVEADSVLMDVDTITALLAGTTNEATNGTWSRKVIAAAAIPTPTPDDVNDRFNYFVDDVIWTSLTGSTVSQLVIAYSPSDTSTSGDGSNVPLTSHAWSVIPDGSTVKADIGALGFYQSS